MATQTTAATCFPCGKVRKTRRPPHARRLIALAPVVSPRSPRSDRPQNKHHIDKSLGIATHGTTHELRRTMLPTGHLKTPSGTSFASATCVRSLPACLSQHPSPRYGAIDDERPPGARPDACSVPLLAEHLTDPVVDVVYVFVGVVGEDDHEVAVHVACDVVAEACPRP